MGFKIFVETPEFLTVRAQFPKPDQRVNALNYDILAYGGKNLTADFVLARKESDYTDGRRPDAVEPGTLEDDLARRDFTMNAIAKAPDGRLIDPFNGQVDIADRIIRAVGDPYERLTEDALRAVRALRFSVTKGFKIDPELEKAMDDREICEKIKWKISDERIQQELSKMFRHNTIDSLYALSTRNRLTTAMFAGNVSLDATMKLHNPEKKAAKKAQDKANSLPTAYNGCTCHCHTMQGVMHIAACCRPGRS
jgi:hypothetical protein